ncbi:ligand-binding sensor domain-containing protein [Chitinophaga vietnamensis]|uniref:ligand-binding sensor domain-containing protein n=1 Tax=Chitinophaga vietnamensis TaxID=2593957 RepID=UPI0013755EF7|nr:sensor histidine kinase [Chitinophaga vietnamensis]
MKQKIYPMCCLRYRWILFLLLLSKVLSAQSYSFRRYETENGLSNNTVQCIVQDQQGFMWFGTKDGLTRFDGYHFKVFSLNDNPVIPNVNYVNVTTVDNEGTLWVGSTQGIYRFDKTAALFHPFLDSLHGIAALHFSRNGDLWLTARGTVYRYDFHTGRLTRFPPEEYFWVTAICEWKGFIWCGTPDGQLKKMDPATGAFTSYDMFAQSAVAKGERSIETILPDDSGGIFVGYVAGLKQFNTVSGARKDLLRYDTGNFTIFTRSILKANDTEFWFGTERGLFIYNTVTKKFRHLETERFNPYSIPDNAVYAVYKDSEGGIWAGTYFGGVCYYNGHAYPVFEKYFPGETRNAISGNVVREICEDHEGNIWMGTEDAGLNKLNPLTGEIQQFRPSGLPGSIAYPNIHGLLAIGDELWIGTFFHGIDIMDIHTGKVKRHISTGEVQFTLCMMQTKNGDVYLGAQSSLYKYDRSSGGFTRPAAVPASTPVLCLTEDHAGTIWAGTVNGVYYFNPLSGASGHFMNIAGNENSLSNNKVNAVLEDTEHRLWFATEGGGLCRLDESRKRFDRYATNNGLPGNFVFKIVEDNLRTLWVTTSKGLVRMDLTGKITNVYTHADGLLTDQFNYNSGFKDRSGKLYFGCIKGMIAFRPDSITRVNDNKFQIYITSFEANNKELKAGAGELLQRSILLAGKVELPYNQSSCSIEFAVPNYTSPAAVKYSYKLEGVDRDWVELKQNRRIYFAGLSPGTYTLHIRATAPFFIGRAEKQLIIKIRPPWWFSGWAYLLYAVILTVLIIYIIRTLRAKQRVKKEKEIYSEKINFFTQVAHEIKTPLTLIKGPVDNLKEWTTDIPEILVDVKMMERNTDRLINLVNQLMDFNKIEANGFSLNFHPVNVSELLAETFRNFEELARAKSLHYSLQMPATDVYIAADQEALRKIFDNLFSNAVKYAASKVLCEMTEPDPSGGMLIITISNDGKVVPAEMREKIFEPFFRLRETSKQRGAGIGLALARSLVNLHKGSLYMKQEESSKNIFILKLPFK